MPFLAVSDAVFVTLAQLTEYESDRPCQVSARRRSRVSVNGDLVAAAAASEPATNEEQQVTEDDNARLIDEETALTGHVKWGVYYDYAKSIGLVGAILAVFFYAFGQILHSLSSVWLSVWSDYNLVHNRTDVSSHLGFYLGK